MDTVISRKDFEEYSLFTISGTPSAADLVSAIREHYTTRMFIKTIWDFSQASVLEVEIEKYAEIALAVKNASKNYQSENEKTALVFRSEHEEILGHAYHAVAASNELDIEYGIFDSIDEATAWITAQ